MHSTQNKTKKKVNIKSAVEKKGSKRHTRNGVSKFCEAWNF